jgi:arsenite-transporting ATPase
MSADLPFLDAPSYKWIFVGGKGGVGKTTTSCSIALSLTRYRERVLLVSTDPASNIGDTLQQHFTREPTPVAGVPRLWAMEYVQTAEAAEEFKALLNLPGMDELQVLSALFDSIERDDFDIVVFDTAPTGHTMRLLQLPQNFGSIVGNAAVFGPSVVTMLGQAIGAGGDTGARMQRLQGLLENAARRIANPMECTFVCVLLPEFLPVFETERLIQFLNEKEVETHVLVVNQILATTTEEDCPFCFKRYQMQQKYIADIHDLYDDFRIIEIGLLETEVKGVEAVEQFARFITPLFSAG